MARRLPERYSKKALIGLCRLIAWTEKQWFLYYARHDTGYEATIRRIRANPLCPPTVEQCYRFWKFNPDHEAFEGMDKSS
jgi:hypothetical protein